MASLFTAEYAWVWTIALGVALFFPVRQLIWVLYIRRAERDGKEDQPRRAGLKRRAGWTSALLCFVFSYFYVLNLFGRS